MSKRKASVLDSAAAPSFEEILLDSSSNHRDVANSLLALLPASATQHDATAQKLVEAVRVVESELGRRIVAVARDNEAPGILRTNQSSDTSCNVVTINSLLPEPFHRVLEYFSGTTELVHSVSLVCKAWMSASRNPILWKQFDSKVGPASDSKHLESCELLALLARPQFSQLESLTISYRYSEYSVSLNEVVIKQIAKCCPYLQELDFGYKHSCSTFQISDALKFATKQFPNLTKIAFKMGHYVTISEIEGVVGRLAERLLELRIEANPFFQSYVSDETVLAVARCCPNLRVFASRIKTIFDDEHLTENGIIVLVEGCRRLQVLDLRNAARVGLSAYKAIVRMQTNKELGLRVLCVTGYGRFRPSLLTEQGKKVRKQLQQDCGIKTVALMAMTHDSSRDVLY